MRCIKKPLYERFFGGDRGSRTPDLLIANQTRYQLRYTPTGLLFGFIWGQFSASFVLPAAPYPHVVNRFFRFSNSYYQIYFIKAIAVILQVFQTVKKHLAFRLLLFLVKNCKSGINMPVQQLISLNCNFYAIVLRQIISPCLAEAAFYLAACFFLRPFAVLSGDFLPI
jgi:hypothetical protein